MYVTCGFWAQFAELSFDGLRDNLLLFVHDQTNPNILQLLTSASQQLCDGVLVEVVLSGNHSFFCVRKLSCITLMH